MERTEGMEKSIMPETVMEKEKLETEKIEEKMEKEIKVPKTVGQIVTSSEGDVPVTVPKKTTLSVGEGELKGEVVEEGKKVAVAPPTKNSRSSVRIPSEIITLTLPRKVGAYQFLMSAISILQWDYCIPIYLFNPPSLDF
jgi:hypothetical protein